MNEYRTGKSFNQAQDCLDLIIGRSAHATEGHIRINKAMRNYLCFLLFPDIVRHSEIDDCFYAKAVKIFEACLIRLCPAIERVANLAKVNNAFRSRNSASMGEV